MVLQQLTYAGVFEAVSIRKSGYPFRMPIPRFTHWYRCLLLGEPGAAAAAAGVAPKGGFKLAPWASDEPGERVRQILAHSGQDLSGVQVGRSLVLYRAKEERLLELLRALSLQAVTPYLQRMVRGTLARECKRRCAASATRLREVLETARSVGECDAAFKAHASSLGGLTKIFSPRVPPLNELREMRRSFEQWVALERKMEAALFTYATAIDDEAETAAYDAVEIALVHAEELKKHVRCTPFQQKMCVASLSNLSNFASPPGPHPHFACMQVRQRDARVCAQARAAALLRGARARARDRQ